MLAAVFILVLSFFVALYIPIWSRNREEEIENEEENDSIKKTPQLKKLWTLAQSAMKERKPLKAEKALLTILKFDEKNAAAYNRLGILYAREKHFKEAIDCFEIAQSLDNNASSLHNVGLIYFETGKYEQAEMAFSKAIEMESDQPGRFIALAKVQEKLGKRKQAIESLETAYSLAPSVTILKHLLEIYEKAEDQENIDSVKQRIGTLLTAKKRTAQKKQSNKAEAKAAKNANKAAAKTAKAAAKAQAKAAPQKETALERARRINAKKK